MRFVWRGFGSPRERTAAETIATVGARRVVNIGVIWLALASLVACQSDPKISAVHPPTPSLDEFYFVGHGDCVNSEGSMPKSWSGTPCNGTSVGDCAEVCASVGASCTGYDHDVNGKGEECWIYGKKLPNKTHVDQTLHGLQDNFKGYYHDIFRVKNLAKQSADNDELVDTARTVGARRVVSSIVCYARLNFQYLGAGFCQNSNGQTPTYWTGNTITGDSTSDCAAVCARFSALCTGFDTTVRETGTCTIYGKSLPAQSVHSKTWGAVADTGGNNQHDDTLTQIGTLDGSRACYRRWVAEPTPTDVNFARELATSTNTSTCTTTTTSDSGLSAGAIAAIASGGVVVAGAAALYVATAMGFMPFQTPTAYSSLLNYA